MQISTVEQCFVSVSTLFFATPQGSGRWGLFYSFAGYFFHNNRVGSFWWWAGLEKSPFEARYNTGGTSGLGGYFVLSCMHGCGVCVGLMRAEEKGTGGGMVTSPGRVPIRLFSLISLPCSVYGYGVDTE